MIECSLPEGLRERLEHDYFVILYQAFEGKQMLTADRLLQLDRIIEQPPKDRASLFEKALAAMDSEADRGPSDTVIF